MAEQEEKPKRGGYRERAGRPPREYQFVTIKLRRCRKCGRFVSYSHGHNCSIGVADK